MPDSETVLDQTAAAALNTVAQTEKLAEAAVAVRREREEWETANGVADDVSNRFFASLSETDKRKAEEERERFEAELKRDLDELEHAASRKNSPPAAGRKKARNFV
ncbi:MAG: hypothetical protein LBV15_00970 [Planctomycetota bacterium]|nr:hypothetical protein [Planctomycetota bacterium]